MTVALPTLTGLPPLCLLPLLVLPLPALRGFLLPAAGAVRHDVPDLAARPAPAVIGRGPVSQLRPVKEVILEQVNIRKLSTLKCAANLNGVIARRSVTDGATKQIPRVNECLLDVQVHWKQCHE